MPTKTPSLSPEMERVMRIAHEHILYAMRKPENLDIIAKRLLITPESALALAIADQVCEEFMLTPNA